jgi:hypothetical protein
MPNRRAIKRWLWPKSSVYQPSDQLIMLSVVIVIVVVVVLVVQGITGTGHGIRVGTGTPTAIVSTSAPAPQTTNPGPIPPAAMAVLQAGVKAQLDSAWTGIPLAPGVAPPASKPTPAVTPDITAVTTLQTGADLVVAEFTVRWEGHQSQTVARAELISAKWCYVLS